MKRRQQHKGSIASHVLDCLARLEPTTSARIAEELDLNIKTVSRVLVHFRGDRCHIARWRRNVDGEIRATAFYKAGPGKDAKRPPPLGGGEIQRRMSANRRVLVNSVFALGTPVRQRPGLARLAGLH